MGAFLFSKGTLSTDQTTQFAACSVVLMSSGIYFLDSAVSIYWEHFFPALAVRWYELLSRKRAVTLETLRKFTHDDSARVRKVAGVGYPQKLSPYYEKIKPGWSALQCPLDDIQLLSMGFHAAREFAPRIGMAPLQFAHYTTHHDLVYSNQLVQSSISLALMMHEKYTGHSNTLYQIKSTSMAIELHSRKHRQINPYVLTA